MRHYNVIHDLFTVEITIRLPLSSVAFNTLYIEKELPVMRLPTEMC